MSAEATVVRNYLDWLLSIHGTRSRRSKKDLANAQEILDHDHYGLDKVKERIVEYLAVQTAANKLTARSCAGWSPGVGKTSLGKSIARATGREFVRVSLAACVTRPRFRHRLPISARCPARSSSRMRSEDLEPVVPAR